MTDLQLFSFWFSSFLFFHNSLQHWWFHKLCEMLTLFFPFCYDWMNVMLSAGSACSKTSCCFERFGGNSNNIDCFITKILLCFVIIVSFINFLFLKSVLCATFVFLNNKICFYVHEMTSNWFKFTCLDSITHKHDIGSISSILIVNIIHNLIRWKIAKWYNNH